MLKESIRQAFFNLFSAKLRSFLAVLGILVGTASVVALITLGHAATDSVLRQFKALGTNVMDVRLSENSLPESNNKNDRAHNLTVEEALNVKSANSELKAVAPYAMLMEPVVYEGKDFDSTVLGGSHELQEALKLQLSEGHFVSLVDTTERYCVIGNKLAAQFKKQNFRSPLGQQVRIGTQMYTIIGILKSWPQNAFFYSDIDNSVIIPLRGIPLVSPNANIYSLILTLEEGADLVEMKKSLLNYFKKVTPDLRAFIRSPQEVITQMEKQQMTLTLLLGLIGGISLFVGGIGVMNVMLVSVSERRREIGIRKAIGARRRDIQLLFLIESVVLATFGGSLGVFFGVTTSLAVAYFVHWPLTIYFAPIIIGFIVSSMTGVFFGFYPAFRAAKLNPIEALRYD